MSANPSCETSQQQNGSAIMRDPPEPTRKRRRHDPADETSSDYYAVKMLISQARDREKLAESRKPEPKLAVVLVDDQAISPDGRKLPSLVNPQPTVSVRVHSPNGAQKTFHVHKDFICHYSPFFDAAFNSKFKEGETQEMDFDDTDIEVFGIFVNWLYTQRIVNSDGKTLGSGFLMNLWLLADRVIIPRLQNQALVDLDRARKSGWSLAPECKRVYANTHEDSPLRRYIIDTWDFNLSLKQKSSYPQELLIGIVNAVKSRKDPTKLVVFSERERSKYFVDEKAGLWQSRNRI